MSLILFYFFNLILCLFTPVCGAIWYTCILSTLSLDLTIFPAADAAVKREKNAMGFLL